MGPFVAGIVVAALGGLVAYVFTLQHRRSAARAILREWLDDCVDDLQTLHDRTEMHRVALEYGREYRTFCGSRGISFLPYHRGHFPDIEQYALAHADLLRSSTAIRFIRLVAVLKRMAQTSDLLERWATADPVPAPAFAEAQHHVALMLQDLDIAQARADDLQRITQDWRRHVVDAGPREPRLGSADARSVPTVERLTR